MSLLLICLALAPAALVFLAYVVGGSGVHRAQRVEQAFAAAKVGVVLSALGAVIALYSSWSVPAMSYALWSSMYIGVLVDRTGAIMWMLVATISFTIVSFSRRYLEGEERQLYFLSWLAVTISTVQVLLLASNLAMFIVAWVAISFALHRLLTFYPQRPAAISCAQQKFLVSRVGDICLIAAAALLVQSLGTLDFVAIRGAVEALSVQEREQSLVVPALLLAVGAIAKSAQLPFHAWLPQSLETPTPVSALMHAGIINAGGFLVLRLSSVFAASPEASSLLALVGGLTALYGMSVMVTQTSIKKRLAYSTVGQMGFMIMQCGLGLYALALLHIVAHGFYKAYAFLRAGSAMDQAREQIFFPERHAYVPLFALVFILVVLTAGLSIPFVISSHHLNLQYLPILVVWGFAASHLGWGIVSVKRFSPLNIVVGATFAAILLGCYAGMSIALTWYLQESATAAPQLGLLVPCTLALIFSLGFVLQLSGKSITRRAWGRRLHLHLHNGFYIEALSRRLHNAVSQTVSSSNR